MRIEAIIYDLDGTGIRSERMWENCEGTFLDRRGITHDHAYIEPLLAGKSMREGGLILQEIYNFPGTPDELELERKAIVHAELNEMELVEGFEEFAKSHRRRVLTAIGTGMHREFYNIIDKNLELTKLVDHITCIEDVNGVGKPDPAIALHAAEALGVNPKYCLFIEDSQNGVDGAWEAGMRTIGLTRVFPSIKADYVVDSFSEINLRAFGYELVNHHSRRK